MDAKILHELFEYRDGELYWKAKRPSIYVGDRAGWSCGNGYRKVHVQKKQMFEHRVIFAMFNNYLPKFIDHIDGNKTNNKIENLREATHSENLRNVKTKINNSSGVKGVCWCKKAKKWEVQVKVNKKKKHLGYFDDIELAALVAHEGRNKYHGSYANHG